MILCNGSPGLHWELSGNESPCPAGDAGWTPGWGRSPGIGNGNPLQYSCLGNPMDRGAWWATVHGVTKESDTTKQQQQQLGRGQSSGEWVQLWCSRIGITVPKYSVSTHVLPSPSWTEVPGTVPLQMGPELRRLCSHFPLGMPVWKDQLWGLFKRLPMPMWN